MFRAYDSARERLVAVKLFKLDLPPERAHQLVAEFEQLIAAGLAHPALVTPLATGISGVSAFLAQDYVAADSLDLIVREYGAAPAGNALRVAVQLAGALDLAAAAQVTHGALHPRDVLLSSDDTRLTGLGVTRALGKIGVVAPVRRPYSAPERIAGGDWDRRADTFSLAALVHELMWGRKVSGLGAKASESLTEFPGSNLAALQAVFACALAEDPGDRFATALEFAQALKGACPGVVVEPDPVSAPKRRAARRVDEPRLPLDQQPNVSGVAPPGPPAKAPNPGERRLGASKGERDGATAREPEGDLTVVVPAGPGEEPLVAWGFSPAEPDAAARPLAAPEIEYQAAPETRPHEPRASKPAGFITGHDPDAMSAMERTRSAVWPLLLALVVGIAIGFAGGFFAGSRDQPVPVASIAAVPASPPEKSEVQSQKSELPSQRLEGRSEKAEPAASTAAPANPKSDLANPKSGIDTLKTPAPTPDGRLLVRSRPAGARVSVDGKEHGVTPAAVRDLTRGAHRLTIARDGYAPQERRFVISASRPAQTLTVTLVRTRAAAPARAPTAVASSGTRSTGALSVDSRPAGATVFVDDKVVGTTPMALPSVSAGSHVIRLEHDGYRPWSSSVRIVASEQNRVTASLGR